jgi:hypothetical protein
MTGWEVIQACCWLCVIAVLYYKAGFDAGKGQAKKDGE